MNRSFRIRPADWQQDQAALRHIRETVFVHEQRVPPELEWDGIDDQCLHMIAEDERSMVIGTGRLLPDGHVGRMAVLPAWRRHGVGAALLAELLAAARERGLHEVVLNAQTHAMAFYARHGFVAEGDEFLDAGIPHRRMRRDLNAQDHGGGSGAGRSGS